MKKANMAGVRRWQMVEIRYHGQEGFTPLECKWPKTALAIMRQLAGERKATKRWENFGGKYDYYVNPKVREALKRRMRALAYVIVQNDLGKATEISQNEIQRRVLRRITKQRGK